MKFRKTRGVFVRLASIALITTGFAQFSWAGVVGTEYMVEGDARNAGLARVEALLARDDIAQQMLHLGVDPARVSDRLHGLTSAELLALEGQIDQQIAGSGALGVLGALFLVLLVLELLDVTDVFKSI